MTSLPIGVAVNLQPGTIYALPAKAVLAAVVGDIETSLDGITFTPQPLTNGQVALAHIFVRAPSPATIISLKEADANVLVEALGDSSGGTAAGDNVTIENADPAITLVDTNGTLGKQRWRIGVGYDMLLLDSLSDAGESMGHPTYIDHGTNQFVTGAINAAGGISGTYLQLQYNSFSAVNNNPAIQAGGIANINDSTVNTIGATVAGGGAFRVLARLNDSYVWKVIGI